MDPSSTGTPEDTPTRRRERPQERFGRGPDGSPKRIVRALLGVEAVSFLLAAAVHAGVLVSGYEHNAAMTAESAIGVVLLAGLVTTWVRPRSTYSAAVGVQAFALLGTLIGVSMVVIGVGPHTVPDIVYHVLIVIVLTVGLGFAWRSRGSESS